MQERALPTLCRPGTERATRGRSSPLCTGVKVAQAKGDDLAGKTFCDLLIVRDLTVDDQSTVCLGIACKLVERGTHICQIFEEIQMFCFYI